MEDRNTEDTARAGREGRRGIVRRALARVSKRSAARALMLAMAGVMLFNSVPVTAVAQGIQAERLYDALREGKQGAGGDEAAAPDAAADAGADDASTDASEQAPLTVTFDGNGAEAGSMAPVEVDGGEKGSVTLPAAAFQRPGFAFAGWSTTADGHDARDADGKVTARAVAVPDGQKIDALGFEADADGDGKVAEGERADLTDSVRDGNLTLYAQWKAAEPAAETPAAAEPETAPPAGADGEGKSNQAAGADEGTVDGSRLTEAKMVEAPQAGAPARQPAAEDASELDGTKIEDVSVEWITKDTKDDGDAATLSLAPGNDDDLQLRMRANIALSGAHDYAAGDIQITVPSRLLAYRDGTQAGQMTLSVPAAPDGRALFSYSVTPEGYVLTNTRRLSAATSAMFEFTWKDVAPHLLVGDPGAYRSEPFSAALTVTTAKGRALSRESGKITATVDTSERADTATAKAYALSEEWDPTWPAELKPAEPEKWVYMDWYSWVTVKGNQSYAIESTHDVSTGDVPGVVALGARDELGRVTAAEAGSKTVTAKVEGPTYLEEGVTGHFVHVWAAYPKEQVPDGGHYRLTDKVTYKLTSADDHEVSSASADADKTYSPIFFPDPRGHYNVFKHTQADDGSWDFAAGRDPSALNRLRKGESVEEPYRVKSDGFMAADTWSDVDGDGKREYEELGTKTVRMVTDDYSTQFDHQETDLTADDAEFASVRLDPIIMRYGKATRSQWGYAERGTPVNADYVKLSAGEWGWTVDTAEYAKVSIETWGRVDGGEWTRFGVATKNADGTLSWAVENGATAAGDTLTFPARVTDFRNVIESRAGGIILLAYPTVRLKPSAAVMKRVEDLYKKSDEPDTILRNWAKMIVDDEDGRHIGDFGPKAADNTLTGSSQGARMGSSLRVENDTSTRRAVLNYTLSITEQSNLTTWDDYEQAIRDGAVSRETSGTWYALLPYGVTPDAGSVRARVGDSVASVRVHEDWRGSGRTMLVVTSQLSPSPRYVTAKDSIRGMAGYADMPAITFSATYPWESLTDYGADLELNAAFRSGNPWVGNVGGMEGEPDDPRAGNNTTSASATKGVEDLMGDLSEGGDAPSTLYARVAQKISVDVSSLTSLTKRVAVNGSDAYGDGQGADARNVYENGSYTYRLRMQNTTTNTSTGLVFYDELDGFTPGDSTDDAGDAQWRGRLASVDVSQMEAAGADPVVYYSTRTGLTLDDTADRSDNDLTDSSIWSATPPADLSKVTAIAIDATRSKEGGTFTLGAGKSVVALVRMRAPLARDLAGGGQASAWYDTEPAHGRTESGMEGGAHAYNNAVLTATMVNTQTGAVSANQLIRNDYTKVGLIPYKLRVTKTWDDDGDRDGIRSKSVKLHLTANDADTGRVIELSDGNGWAAEIDGLVPVDEAGHAVQYGVTEEAPTGYDYGVTSATEGETTVLTVTNRHEPETIDVSGEKRWDDSDDLAGKRPESIRLDLYADGERDRGVTVRPDASGSWRYEFADVPRYADHGREIRYEVREDAYYEGYAPAKVEGTTVTNAYDPKGSLEIRKTATGTTAASATAEFTFRVALTGADGQPDGDTYAWASSDGRAGTISNGGTVTMRAGQSVTVSGIPSETAYEVTEQAAPGFSVAGKDGDTGSIKAGRTVTAAFENAYDAEGGVDIAAKKVLDGRALERNQFRFELIDDATGEVVRTASNAADGTVAFGRLSYGLADAGKTFSYTIRERQPEDYKPYEYVLPDGRSVFATDTKGSPYEIEEPNHDGIFNLTKDGKVIASSGDGLTEETIESDGEAFKLLKTSDGSLFALGYISNDFGATVGETGTLAAIDASRGLKLFSRPNHLAPTIPISNKTLRGYSYDSHTEKVSVKVDDKGDGTLTATPAYDADGATFTNTYRATGSVDIKAWKVLKGRDLKAGEFTFELRDAAGKVLQTAENAADGTITFNPLPFTQADAGKTYAYTVSERDTGDATVTYSKQSFTYTVKVVDDADGTLSFDASSDESPVFENAAKPGSLRIEKSVGANDPNKEFEFDVQLTGADGQPLPEGEWSYKHDQLTPLKGTATITGDAVVGSTVKVDASKVGDGAGLKYEWHAVDGSGQDTVIQEGGDSLKVGGDLDGKQVYVVVTDGTGKASGAVVSDRRGVTAPVAFAVWSADDKSLDFYKRDAAPAEGTEFEGKTATKVWTGIEGTQWKAADDAAWKDIAAKVESVKVVDAVKPVSMAFWFNGMSALSSVDLGKLDSSATTDMTSLFAGDKSLTSLDVSKLDTGSNKGFGYMFYGCTGLTNLDVSHFDTHSAISMESMFDSGTNAVPMRLKALDVSGFDTSNVEKMNRMFARCADIESLDVSHFDTSKVKTLEGMFGYMSKINILSVSSWITSSVTDMTAVFEGCTALTNLDLSSWDTSNVTRMWATFYHCTNLSHLDLSNWNTSKVTTFRGLFCGNSYVGDMKLDMHKVGVEKWDTSSALDMSWMLYGCSQTQELDLSGWDVSHVRTLYHTFTDNFSLKSLTGLNKWDTSNVESLDGLFNDCRSLETIDLSNWDTSNVTDMAQLFENCHALREIKGLNGWDTSKVTGFSEAFKGVAVSELDLSSFDSSSVKFGTPVSFTTADGTQYSVGHSNANACMFGEEEGQGMGADNDNFYRDPMVNLRTVKLGPKWDPQADGGDPNGRGLLPAPDPDHIAGADGYWYDAETLQRYAPDEIPANHAATYTAVRPGAAVSPLASVRTALAGAARAVAGLFHGDEQGAREDGSADADAPDDGEAAALDGGVAEDGGAAVSDAGTEARAEAATPAVSDTSLHVVQNAAGNVTWQISADGTLTIAPENGTSGTLDLGKKRSPWYGQREEIKFVVVKKTVKMLYSVASAKTQGPFNGLSHASSMDLSGLDTSQVTSMRAMFYGCSGLTTIDLSSFDTSKVTNMSSMFYGCSGLTSLDLAAFDTSKVTNMDYMFYGCSGLTSLDLAAFDTSNVTSMRDMFYGCSGLTSLDLAAFDTSKVTNMDYMFENCSSIESLNLSSFDTSKATEYSTSGIFFNCYSLITMNLGEKSIFESYPVISAQNGRYTGKWIRKDGMYGPFTPWEMETKYTGGDMTGLWVAEKAATDYTVSFDANGGTGSMTQQKWSLGSFGTIPESAFTWFDHDFTGWNTKPDGSGTAYVVGQKLDHDLVENAGETVTLYAQWKQSDNKVDVSKGRFTVKLHGNEAATIEGIPAGTGYTVRERTPAGWVVVASSGTSGKIEPLGTSVASFTNDYRPGVAQAQVTGTKTLDGQPAAAGAFRFELVEAGRVVQTVSNAAGGGFSFSHITYASAGVHTYQVREVAGPDATIAYDSHAETVTVTVTDDGQGNLSATVAHDADGVAFANRHRDGSLKIEKKVEGGGDAATEFTFRVELDGGRDVRTVKVRAGGSAVIDGLAPGTTYKVTEVDVPSGYTEAGAVGASGTIAAATESAASFTNAYAASGSAVIEASKALVGGSLAGGEFTFELRDESGALVGTATNGADGKVLFDPVVYTSAGTYRYTVAERAGGDAGMEYDGHVEDVTVKVTDKGDGNLATEVSYDADGCSFTNRVRPGELTISKKVEGGTPAALAREFTFRLSLKAADGAAITDEVPWTSSDGRSGAVADGGTITLRDGQTATVQVPGGASYSVTEEETAGFTSSAEGATGVMEAGASHEAAFTNAYAASGSWVPVVGKVLEGSELKAGQFTFTLTDASGKVVGTAKNDADGKVAFDPVAFTQADDGKTFTYEVTERNDRQRGITYDDKVVSVSVEVADKGDGTVVATATYDGAPSATFTNRASVALPGTGRAGIAGAVAVGALVLAASAAAALRRKRR